MDISTQVLIGVGIAVFLPILITYLTTTYNTDAVLRFFWGDQKIRSTQCAQLLTSTAFALNGVLYFAFLGWWIGWAALILQCFWCGSYFWLARYAHKIKSLSQFGTLHGAIGATYGKGAELAAAIASIAGFALILGWEISIGASLFQSVAQGNEIIENALVMILIVGFAGIGAIYTVIGGLRGNIRANKVQNVLAASSLAIILGFLIWKLPASGFAQESTAFNNFLTEFGIAAILSNALFSIFYQFVDMSAWQNLAATESEGAAQKKALKLTAIAVFLFPGLFGTMIGIYMRAVPGVSDTNIITMILLTMADYPVLLIVVVMGLMGAMLSTIDGLLLAGSQSTVWDLTHRKKMQRILAFYHKDGKEAQRDEGHTVDGVEVEEGERAEIKSTERQVLRWSRALILAISFAGAVTVGIFTIQFEVSAFDLVYIAYTAQLALLPVAFSVLRGHSPRHGGFASITSGLVAGFGFLGYAMLVAHRPDLYPWSPIVSAAAATVVWWVASQARRQPK